MRRGDGAGLALGLLEGHLDVAAGRDEGVDDSEEEHGDRVENILPVPHRTELAAGLTSLSSHTMTLFPGKSIKWVFDDRGVLSQVSACKGVGFFYLHPLMYVGVTVSALGEFDLTVDGSDLKNKEKSTSQRTILIS